MSRQTVSNTPYFDFDLNKALGDWDVQKNIVDPSYTSTGSGENISIQWDPHDKQNFTWQDPSSGKKYVLSGSDSGYNVRGDFDVGEKGLVSANSYDPTGKYLNTQSWNRGKSGDDLLGAALVMFGGPLVGAGLAGLAGGAGAGGIGGISGASTFGGVGGADAAATAAAMGGGGLAGATTAPIYGGSAVGMELAPLGEIGAGAIPEGMAFAPATASDMAGMGLGGSSSSGLLTQLGTRAINSGINRLTSGGQGRQGGGGMSGVGNGAGLIPNTHAIAELMENQRKAREVGMASSPSQLPLGTYEALARARTISNLLKG